MKRALKEGIEWGLIAAIVGVLVALFVIQLVAYSWP